MNVIIDLMLCYSYFEEQINQIENMEVVKENLRKVEIDIHIIQEISRLIVTPHVQSYHKEHEEKQLVATLQLEE